MSPLDLNYDGNKHTHTDACGFLIHRTSKLLIPVKTQFFLPYMEPKIHQRKWGGKKSQILGEVL